MLEEAAAVMLLLLVGSLLLLLLMVAMVVEWEWGFVLRKKALRTVGRTRGCALWMDHLRRARFDDEFTPAQPNDTHSETRHHWSILQTSWQ